MAFWIITSRRSPLFISSFFSTSVCTRNEYSGQVCPHTYLGQLVTLTDDHCLEYNVIKLYSLFKKDILEKMCYYQVSDMLSHEIVRILICIPQAGIGKFNSQDVYLISINCDVLFQALTSSLELSCLCSPGS